MCLDMSLNKDDRECHHMHVSITQHLVKMDPCHFSLSTPKEISRAIKRLLHPSDSGVVPTSVSIIQDVDRLESGIKEIMRANGYIVSGFLKWTGHQKNSNGGTYSWR